MSRLLVVSGPARDTRQERPGVSKYQLPS